MSEIETASLDLDILVMSNSDVASGGAGCADCPATRISVPIIRKVKFPLSHT